MSDPVVRVEHLVRTFGDFRAVDDVSFEVGRGEVFGFLGPNGAGKTTTIKMLTGLLRPTSGHGTVSGFDIATQPDEIKQRIGYMSQLFSLYADLTVDENITFFSGLYGVPRDRRSERRRWVLDMAGLENEKNRLVRELSLGWKQRLALGCAVLHEPPILFLDEPTSGVDPLSRRNFWELIYTLARGGTTVFVSTHYMEEAEYCDRLALMNRGAVIALDTPSAIRGLLRQQIVEIVTDDAVTALRAAEESGLVHSAGLVGRNVHAIVDDARSAMPKLEETLRAAGVNVRSVRRVACFAHPTRC